MAKNLISTFPDAELIRVCAAFEANETAIREIYDSPVRALSDEAAAEEAAPLEGKIEPLLERLDTLRASTSAGVHARARLLYAHDPGHGFDWASIGTRSNKLLVTLLRDAMAFPAGFDAASAADADMIRTSDSLADVLAAYAVDENAGDGEAGAAYDRVGDAIDAFRPQSVAGMVAKAKAALVHASGTPGLNVTRGERSTVAEGWAWDLMHDLLRLHGGGEDVAG